jgi:predicted metalloprotease
MAPQQGPGFGWGPTFGPPPGPGGSGFQPGWQPQRPRKKPKGPLIAILGIVGVVVVGAWMFGVIKKNADNVATPPVSSGRYTPEPVESPTSAPTEQPTSTASPSQGKSDAEIAAKNALYAVGQMATVNCKEPSVRPTTARNAAAYWAAIKPCLDKSWAPLVAKAGYTFKAPTMMYWQGTSVNNPCGSGPVSVPFYCSANHVMYMKVDVFVKSYNEYPDAEAKAYARMWYSRSIAHEYGHSVQYMTGILQAASAMRYEQPDEAGQMRMTRRMELQANCFAGVFLAANKRSYPINGLMLSVWTKYVVTAGDKPEEGDHGSVASQARFMGKSFTTANPASCNTFAASAANVS